LLLSDSRVRLSLSTNISPYIEQCSRSNSTS